MREIKMWIPMEELQNCHLYRINARNAEYGIWIEEDKAFMISRVKCGYNILFGEDHWDTGFPYGTVKPIREICRAPFCRPLQDLSKLYFIAKGDKDGKKKRKRLKRILRYLNIFEDREWKRKMWLRTGDRKYNVR